MLCCGGLSEKMGGSWSDRMEEDFSFAASYPLKIQNKVTRSGATTIVLFLVFMLIVFGCIIFRGHLPFKKNIEVIFQVKKN